MGCQESGLLSPQENRSISMVKSAKHDRRSLNITFSDFVRGNTGQVFDEYQFTGWINRSQNSIVRWAWHRRSDAERVVKIFRRNIENEAKVMKQINCLKKLDHPNIIKLYEYFIDNDFIYLILEPACGSRIYNSILGAEQKVVRNLRTLMKQILQACEHCHSRGIAHFNLVPENIIVLTDEKQTVVGFGDALLMQQQTEQLVMKSMDKQNKTACMEMLETPDTKKQQTKTVISKARISQTYRSPELSTIENLHKQDIWSCGVLMEKILSKMFGAPRFMSLQKQALQELVQKNSKCISESNESIDLLQRMLDPNPDTRYSAYQCLNHAYFSPTKKSSPWKITVLYRSLHNFQIKQKFKTFLTMYLTFKESSLNDQTQFLTQFYNLDKNKDGMLQYDELLQGLINHFNLDEKQASQYIDEIFNRLDKNKNGCIQYSQFLLGTVDIASILEKKSIKNLFNQIDKNRDGYIDEDEMRDLMQDSVSVRGILAQFTKSKDKDERKNSSAKVKISEKQFEEVIKTLYQQGKFQGM